ncbi:MAG: ribulose-phosphate 3-epimerase [Desulfobacterota bacterium]|nr:ribulose-phosphate 3-epimerase [Thermodesulfobacteriota bacterium]
MQGVLIAASLLSCDFLNLEKEIRQVDEAGCDIIHVDVMDGHFVPNLTIGPMIVEAIRKVTKKPLDCHLMVKNPASMVRDFIEAGADIVTVHIEAEEHILRTIDFIKKAGKKAGVTLNPGTSLSLVEEVIPYIDLLLIMTVNPGFGGQTFIPSMYEKIRRAKSMIREKKEEVLLEVDGGVKASNAKLLVELGADILVMGTEIFKSKDYKKKIEEIREIVAK